MKRILFGLSLFMLGLFHISAVSNLDTGDAVKYNNIDFYVVSSNKDYYTLMKGEPIKSSDVSDLIASTELDSSIVDLSSTYVKIPYYYRDNCNSLSDYSGCTTDYTMSDVKQLVDVWASKYLDSNDLVKDKNGYTTRLITYDEMFDYLGYELYSYDTFIASSSYENTPTFAYNDDYYYWTMTSVEDSKNKLFFVTSTLLYKEVDSSANVRPLINVKKDKVELVNKINKSTEEVSTNDSITKKAYKKGDLITYNGMRFYVLKDSLENSSTVTLIKVMPLTVSEIMKYGASKVNQFATTYPYATPYDGVGKVAYYASDTCKKFDIISGCTTDYNKSGIKVIVDNWVNDRFNASELASDEYGYKARLLNSTDITDDLYYVPTETEVTSYNSYYDASMYTPDYNLANCWTMSSIEDYNEFILKQGTNNNFYPFSMYQKAGTVCPVVTILKDGIEQNEVVNSPDTYLQEPYMSTIIGFIIIAGLIVFSIVYIKKNANSK